MKIYSFFLVLSVLYVFTCYPYKRDEPFNQRESRTPVGVDTLFTKHDSMDIFVASYFVNPCVREKYINEFRDDATDYEINYCALKHNMAKFYQNPIRFFELNKYLTPKDGDLIERWCLLSLKINSIPLSNDETTGVLFEELIFNMNNGAEFFKPFITHKDQYWGSLAFNQICRLKYDILSFLTYTDIETETAFFSDYFQTFQKLSSKPVD